MNEVQQQSSAAAQASHTQRGLIFTRRFTTEGVSPYDELKWEQRTASITDRRATRSSSRRMSRFRSTGR